MPWTLISNCIQTLWAEKTNLNVLKWSVFVFKCRPFFIFGILMNYQVKKISVLILSVAAILTSCKDEGDVGLALQNPDDLVGTNLIGYVINVSWHNSLSRKFLF